MHNDIQQNQTAVLSKYTAISRTFTYGIYVTLPLLIAYKLGLTGGEMNGAEIILSHIGSIFGALSLSTGFIISSTLLTIGIGAYIFLEKSKMGNIDIYPIYAIRTLKEALFVAAPTVLIASLISFGRFPPPAFTEYESLLEIPKMFSQAAGAGFFEELLFRVLLLGSIVSFVKKYFPNTRWTEPVCVLMISLLFTVWHYTGWFGLIADEFYYSTFLYRFLFSVVYGVVYLKRGYANAAWTHTMANMINTMAIMIL